MRWRIGDDWYRESEDKRYRVSKAVTPKGTKYTAWVRKGEDEWLPLAYETTAEAAKAACERHAGGGQ